MSPTYESVPSFQGDLSPDDAVSWLRIFVLATATQSDSGILRLFSSKLVDGSPAREWFDELQDELKTSWIPFERQFRARWFTAALARAREAVKWTEFCNHKLTYEMVFPQESLNASSSDKIVIAWAKDHFLLGQATNHTDAELLEKTNSLIPAFIHGCLEETLNGSPSNFTDYCRKLEELPLRVYRSEWHRFQRTLKDMNPLQSQINQISEKVDNILATLSNLQIGARVPPRVPLEDHSQPEVTRPDESVAWEPCSPLTSVAHSLSEVSISEVATPIAEQTPLPVVEDDNTSTSVEEETFFVAPSSWRKPLSNLKKQDRVEIVDQAIDFILKFGSRISNNQASSVNSAAAIYDRLTGRKAINGSSRVLFPSNGSPEALWKSIEMIHHYRADGHPFTLESCRDSWGQFIRTERITNTSTLHYVLPRGSALENRWQDNPFELPRQPSGIANMAGGLLTVHCIVSDRNGYNFDVRILSDKTILFMTLSSYLAECTNDPEFLEFAIQAAICIKTYMLDPESQLVKDCHFDALTGQEKPGSTRSCYLTGIFIEGLSVLATITGDDLWKSLAFSIAEAAMNSRSWHRSEGILSVGFHGSLSENNDTRAFKGLLNRGLMVAYERNPTNKPFRQMVRSYINVQFNALQDLASRQNSYGVNWMGPYVGPYPHGQIAALDTLIAAISVNES